MKRKRLIGFVPLGLAALMLSGCGGGGVDSITGANDPRVRFVNAAPAAPNMDVELSTVTLQNNVAFGTVVAYKRFGNGNRSVNIRATGTNTVLYDSDPDPLFEETKQYTIVAMPGAAGLEGVVYEDSTTAGAENQARVRVIHAATNAGVLDVYLTAPGADISLVPPTYTVDYQDFSDPYTVLSSGTYMVTVTKGGSKTPIVQQNITFASTSTRTLLLMPNVGGTDVASITVLPDRN